jgi:hypothetical protein
LRRTPRYQQIEGQQASFGPPKTSSRRNCTPTPSPTPSRTERPALPRGLLQARRQKRSQAGEIPRQESHRRGHPRQARRRHRRAQVQCPLATASINDAIEYHELFKPKFRPSAAPPIPTFAAQYRLRLLPACRGTSRREADSGRPAAGKGGQRSTSPRRRRRPSRPSSPTTTPAYGTNHSIGEFDLYYQDVQKRIKDQQFPNADLPHKGAEKIDITIVVDMLLTGFDSKYLNTLYVDKNLKHHGLIQAFSRTNRVLNATKPYGNILDFRQQQTPWMPPSPSSPAKRN